jgi:hypothetical protein
MIVAGSEAILWPWCMCASSFKEKLPKPFSGRGFLWKLASDANNGNGLVRLADWYTHPAIHKTYK